MTAARLAELRPGREHLVTVTINGEPAGPLYEKRVKANGRRSRPRGCPPRLVSTLPAGEAPLDVEAWQGRRGHRDGWRELNIDTHQMSKEWRRRAKLALTAQDRVNAVMPAPYWIRGRTAGDHLPFDHPEVQERIRAYREALAVLLDYPNPKPKHVLCLMRAAAEVMDIPDPCWSAADRRTPTSMGESVADIVFNGLFRRVQKAMREIDQ